MQSCVRSIAAVAAIFVFSVLLAAGTPGSFRGTIVEAPGGNSGRQWIYVQGRNGMARKVEISHARVIYDESVPAAARSRNPTDALLPGAEVRVTAEQGSDGEWKANRVEILKPAAASDQRATRSLLLKP